MKTSIHPDWMETKIKCNGCATTFTSHSTVSDITVDICSNCHPFYTGKQKLLDTAGRVDKFKARQAAAQKHQAKDAKPAEPKNDPLDKIEEKLEDQTVELPTEETTEESNS